MNNNCINSWNVHCFWVKSRRHFGWWRKCFYNSILYISFVILTVTIALFHRCSCSRISSCRRLTLGTSGIRGCSCRRARALSSLRFIRDLVLEKYISIRQSTSFSTVLNTPFPPFVNRNSFLWWWNCAAPIFWKQKYRLVSLCVYLL